MNTQLLTIRRDISNGSNGSSSNNSESSIAGNSSDKSKLNFLGGEKSKKPTTTIRGLSVHKNSSTQKNQSNAETSSLSLQTSASNIAITYTSENTKDYVLDTCEYVADICYSLSIYVLAMGDDISHSPLFGYVCELRKII